VSLPDRPRLPLYLAPIPRRVEDLALRLAWPLVAVNLLGTAFGFWYYRFQFADTPGWLWPLVPDSPAATLFFALSLASWKLGREADVLHAAAFVGCLKLGLWTPFVQLLLNGQGDVAAWLYWFLVLSHLGMAVQAFLVLRYADVALWATSVVGVWYWLNDVFDYFVAVGGDVHHTYLRAEVVAGRADHGLAAHDHAAAAAVTLTLLGVSLLYVARAKRAERG